MHCLFGGSIWRYLTQLSQDQLETFVASLSLRHEKEDTYSDGETSFLELPAIRYETVNVQLSSDELRVYKSVESRLLGKLKSMGLLKQTNWRLYFNAVVLRMRQLASDYQNVTGDPAIIRHWADAQGYWERAARLTLDDLQIDRTELERRLEFVHLDDLQKPPLRLGEERAGELRKELDAPQPECSVCMDAMEAGTPAHPTVTKCGHLFCGSCILGMASAGNTNCPQCRAGPLSTSDLYMIRKSPKAEAGDVPEESAASSSDGGDLTDSELKRIFDESRPAPGSKVNEVVAKVLAVQDDEPAAKFLLFSVFDGTRTRLANELRKKGVNVSHVLQNASPGSQAKQLQQFNENPDCAVLLLNIQVANVGLNLTSANHIFFIDQPLSLTQTKQAVGRCHRIGQGRPVTVWSFVVAETIEAAIASAAAKQMQEAEAPEAGQEGDQPKRMRGRNLLGKEELMEYFRLEQDEVYDPKVQASASH